MAVNGDIFKKRRNVWISGQRAIGLRLNTPDEKYKNFPGGWSIYSRIGEHIFYAITYDTARCPEDVKSWLFLCSEKSCKNRMGGEFYAKTKVTPTPILRQFDVFTPF